LVRPFEFPVDVVEDRPYDTMVVSDLLLVASGTVTLEAAILNTPMVILYRVSPLTYWIGRMMAKVKHIGLVNLVAGKTVAPELIQKGASPERLSHEALSLLLNENRMSAMKSELAYVREKLGAPGASRRTAHAALEMMSRAA
jgi:lipid-A-disaccharide synthase